MLKLSSFWRNRTEEIAAIDLGSNSFHMIIAKISNGQLSIIDRLREPVRLGYGLDTDGRLDDLSQKRALDCLTRFQQRIQYIPANRVRAVGTRTLRQAKNAEEFLLRAEKALGNKIHVISGVEEARLVYHGVAFGLEDDNQKRLVIDIGGGSTEIIIGQDYNPLSMESLGMGCVSITRKFFEAGDITPALVKRADVFCRQKLEPFQQRFRQQSWQRAIGCSGSIKAVSGALEQLNGHPAVTLEGMEKLIAQCIEAKSIDSLKIAGVGSDRMPVFIGGLIVLNATMKALKIASLEASPWALREGLLFDLLGHDSISDMKERSVTELGKRFHADVLHAERTSRVALQLFDNIQDEHKFDDNWQRNLAWASMLHEVGLDINHDGYHRHGGYIVENCHMAGFGFDEQSILACLVQFHRKKPDWAKIEQLPAEQLNEFYVVLQIFRLACILTRARSDLQDISWSISFNGKQLRFCAPPAWWNEQTLAAADLESEVKYMKKSPVPLSLNRPEEAE
ncbi:exopolyphosphatase [Reinekea marinisedimentorum]|uniref:Exopolyphosphatase n=1 Tax=Reinekea marinisedimentorum TaxID=230495 RepID=A0A4R3IBR7_9GAMM|nr:exopolyphosphatase [Reinekea marinisedimentorum]TCS44080.1 exopolyphosphatase/guanosine-5'-triphosphate,3'-diphosphate pyrophosphatase [Reinekea marinisedimentorum]